MEVAGAGQSDPGLFCCPTVVTLTLCFTFIIQLFSILQLLPHCPATPSLYSYFPMALAAPSLSNSLSPTQMITHHPATLPVPGFSLTLIWNNQGNLGFSQNKSILVYIYISLQEIVSS